METSQETQEKRYNKIRSKPDIGYNISQFLSQMSDRSQLVESKNKGNGRRRPPYDGFLVHPDDRDRICLSTRDAFRTHPDPEDGSCAPFTVSEQGGTCCVQTNLVFCAAVAAIIRREGNLVPREVPRIPNEIYMWLTERRPDLLLVDHEVRVDTSTSDGQTLLDFAAYMRTRTPIRLALDHHWQILPGDVLNLGGRVTVDEGTAGVGSLDFISLEGMVTDPSTSFPYLSVDCAVDILPAQNEVAVATMINNTTSRNDYFEYSLMLPQRIPVQSVGQQLVAQGWHARPGPTNGPTQETAGIELEITYNLLQNRIFVSKDNVRDDQDIFDY